LLKVVEKAQRLTRADNVGNVYITAPVNIKNSAVGDLQREEQVIQT